MKTLVTLILLSISFGAVAQRSSSKHITTDGRQLRIRVELEQAGRSVHYNRSFNVDGMDEKAVKALENHVIDSLDRAIANQETEIRTERMYTERKNNRDTYTSSSESRDKALQASTSSLLTPNDVMPSSVLVKEDKENGRLWMQYTFQKDGEELVIERTANVTGKSEREKQAIVKETERSFGIRTGNQ
jgi:hypothetical protein